MTTTTTTHDSTNTTTKRSSLQPLQQTDGVRAHQHQLRENSKKLVFCYDDEQQLCVSLHFFFCLIEAIIIVSSLRRRPVSYDQGRVSKHISDIKMYGFRSFTLLRFPFFFSLSFALAIILSLNGWPFSLPLTHYTSHPLERCLWRTSLRFAFVATWTALLQL